MPAPIKHILLALLLGLAINWLVVWALTEVPRRLHIGTYIRSIVSRPDPNSPGAQDQLQITEYRWVGVIERQLHKQQRSITGVTPSRISVWWAWSPLASQPSVFEEFDRLRMQLDNPDIDPDSSVYSDIGYGFPAISARALGAVNDAVVLPDGSYARQMSGAFSTPIIDPSRSFKASTAPLALHTWLPYRPVWAGMLINTVFYTLLAWCVLAVLRAFRHARRMHRGRCPACEYDLGYDLRDGCPECGWRRRAQSLSETQAAS